MLSAWKPRQRGRATNGATRARPDAGGHLLHLLAGETGAVAVEVTVTPRDRLMTVDPGHVVDTMIVGVARHETRAEDATSETKGSVTARMISSDLNQGQPKESNRRAVNGMDIKDRSATTKAVLVIANSRQMCHRTSQPITRKPHSRLLTRLHSLHHHQCRTSSLARSPCSPSRRLLRRCSSRDLGAFLAECHRLHRPTSADRTLHRRQTLLQRRTIHTISTINGATSNKGRPPASISNKTQALVNSRAQAVSKIKALIQTKHMAKVDSRADEVGMEGAIKSVGTTTEAATRVGEGEDIDVASQKYISVVGFSSCWVVNMSIVWDTLTLRMFTVVTLSFTLATLTSLEPGTTYVSNVRHTENPTIHSVLLQRLVIVPRCT